MLVESLLHGANDLESDDKKKDDAYATESHTWDQSTGDFSGIIPSSIVSSSRDYSGEVSSVLSFSSAHPSFSANGTDSEMTTGGNGNAEGLGFVNAAGSGAVNGERTTDDGADSGLAAQHVVRVSGGAAAAAAAAEAEEDAAGGKNLCGGKVFAGKQGSGRVEALGGKSEFVSMYPIICDDLRKVYPARDGSKSKVAVKGMSLAVGRGECFGMLGPNGAGKTTSLNMVRGRGREGGGEGGRKGVRVGEEVSE